MTFIAKFLVCVHFGLSLALATAAFGLYTNRLDWTATAAKADQPAGLLAQREEEYKGVCVDALRPADARYRAQETKLKTKEVARPGEQAWYATELEHLKTGTGRPSLRVKRDATKQTPIPRTPTAQNPAYLEMENPKGYDNQDVTLQSLQFYQRKCAETLAAVDVQLAAVGKAAQEEKSYTMQLAGDRGVHNRTRDEKVKRDLATQEYKDLKPDWINTVIELNNLEQLRTRLTERIGELRGTPTN